MANDVLRGTGDYLQAINPIAGLIIAARNDDEKMYTASYLLCMGFVGLGKYGGRKLQPDFAKRPDGTAYTGMPSGHTMSAWHPAAYTRNPFLYATAILTAASRVTSKRHFWYQCLASIVISEGIVSLKKQKNLVVSWNGESLYIGVLLRSYT